MKVVVFGSDRRLFVLDEPQRPEIIELTAVQAQQVTALIESGQGARYIDGQITAAPLPVPAIASAGDFMRALIELGWFDAVEAAIAAVPGDEGKLLRALWTRAAVFERHNPRVLQIAAAIGKTSADLDDLFLLANSYN